MPPSASPVVSSPFTRAVVSSMRKLYPESLSDKSFDNTGLLLEAPFNPGRRQKNSVLLTIDLTTAVADEAIERKDSIIISYHPIIFRGLKSLKLDDPQQHSLLRLVQEGISVYSPHTAVDVVPDGMADWLCDIVAGDVSGSQLGESSGPEDSWSLPGEQSDQSASGSYTNPQYPQSQQMATSDRNSPVVPHLRSILFPCPAPVAQGFESAGVGRLVTFASLQPLTTLVERIGHSIGNPAGIAVAVPQSASTDTILIRTVGICPGSGADVLMKLVNTGLPDLLLTGELSHHQALAVIERGSVVIAAFHSNSERGYLGAVMQAKLREALTAELKAEKMEEVEEFSVDVSQRDRDPYGIAILRRN